MSSVSLAITAVSVRGSTRGAYPTVFPYADPRAIGISAPQPVTPTPPGNDIASLSESVRDRVSLSGRVRPSPQADRTAHRKQPLARPVTRNTAAQTLLEMADSVDDQVTLSRPAEKIVPRQTVYSKNGTPGGGMQGETSPDLEALAADVTDQVTLTATAPDQGTEGPEITVYIGGNRRDGSSRMGTPSFNGSSQPAVT